MKYLVIQHDGKSEYYFYEVIDRPDGRISLNYSDIDKGVNPVYRGTTAADLTDTGDGVTIDLLDKGKVKTIELDYSEIEHVALLYEFYKRKNSSDTKIYRLDE